MRLEIFVLILGSQEAVEIKIFIPVRARKLLDLGEATSRLTDTIRLLESFGKLQNT